MPMKLPNRGGGILISAQLTSFTNTRPMGKVVTSLTGSHVLSAGSDQHASVAFK